ncbi:Intradiol ring-cleavage dioxygenase [Apiospora saccharicola]|uniref:Intradiol ring-cleavage dioxygenase n=1 Tax=Apiospora saccharicola TaxID=335842 RepID=A0ABR1U213_9PEZI
MKFSTLLVAGSSLLSAAAVQAHGDAILPRSEVQRRDQLARRCASAAGAFNAKRMTKRSNTVKRQATTAPEAETHYKTIQNETCVMTPEVIMGPYVWPMSQLIRTDMSEDQPGVPLTLDIGVLDMATCEPLQNAMVSLWHCNATGDYSSFEELDENLTFTELKAKLGLTNVTYGITDLHTGNSTWLRGMYPTNKEGMVEMKTVFPGFYAGRTIHIHSQVFTHWTLAPNGTMRSGDLVSTGQLYFDESLTQTVLALEPYAQHTQIQRTGNDVDKFIGGSMESGYSPFVRVEPLDGDDVTKGMVGYITLGVDTANLSRPPNYIEPASPYEKK